MAHKCIDCGAACTCENGETEPLFCLHCQPEVRAGLHQCPAGGQCWCDCDKEKCMLKPAPAVSIPNQLKLF